MHYEILRYSRAEKSTIGMMFEINSRYTLNPLQDFLPENMRDKSITATRDFLCYTLEPYNHIPAGIYDLKLRTEGGHHSRYKKKFPSIHCGMLWVMDVPGYKYILHHIGNDFDDTDGCTLYGNSIRHNLNGHAFLADSASAYQRVYSHIVLNERFNTEKTTIEYRNYYNE
jgi:hypothetical protein